MYATQTIVIYFVKNEKAADRVMQSVTNWGERKLYLKVSAEKTKVVRPTKSQFLGFTFWKQKVNGNVSQQKTDCRNFTLNVNK